MLCFLLSFLHHNTLSYYTTPTKTHKDTTMINGSNIVYISTCVFFFYNCLQQQIFSGLELQTYIPVKNLNVSYNLTHNI